MSKKILLVEDEALIAMAEANMLKKHGYEVLTVNTGWKAVDAVDSDPAICLILMDIDLGKGIDGTEAAGRILAAHDLPIVFLSSHTEAEVVEKTEKITSFGYVVKNSGETVLLASIRMAFRLWESEDKFRKAFDYTSVGMVLTSPSGELLRVNDAFTSMLGYSPSEIVSVKFSELTHPEDLEKSIAHLKEMIEGKTDHSRFIKRYIRKDGSPVWADVNTMLLRDSDRRPLHFITHIQDITESRIMQDKLDKQREEYEKNLRNNEAMYRNLMENSIDAVYLLSRTGDILQVNNTACDMLGYSKSELLQLTIDDVDPNYPSRHFIEFWNSKPEGTTVLFETVHRHKNGKEIPVEVNGIFFILDGRKYLFGVSRNITERAGKEKALKKAEEKYRLLFNYSNDAIFVHEIGDNNLPGKNIEVNERACKLLQYSREELLSMSARDVVPGELAAAMLPHAQELVERKHLVFETENIRRDGTHIPVEVSAYWYQEEDRKFAVASVRDITGRKEKEKLLANYNRIFEASQELAKIGSWEWDIVHDTWTFSEQWKKIHGVSYENDVHTGRLLNIAHPEDAPFIEKAFSEAREEGKAYNIQHRIIRADNKEIRYIHALGTVEYSEITGSPVRMVGTAQDITERKQAEDALKEKSNLLERVFDNNTDLIALTDLEGNYKMAGKAHKILGYEIEDLIGKNVMDFVHPDDVSFTGGKFSEFVESSNIRNAVYRYRRIDGEYLWFETTGVMLKDTNGRPEQILFNTRNITDRKLAEERLAKQNRELKLKDKAIQNALSGIAFNDMEGRILFVNDALVKMFGCENKDEVYGRTFFDGHPESEFEKLHALLETLQRDGSCKTDLKAKKVNGDLFDVQVAATLVPDESGKPIYIMASFEDISERKKSERILRKTLMEKDFLMKELNHRVKNNLFMVSSLINLKGSETAAELTDIQHQIEAIGLIHEKLYQTGNVTEICCSDYFNDLLTTIFSSFTARNVTLILEVEDICVPTKTAMSLGLIINEIATNAIKHGFNEKEEPLFSIKMRKERESSRYELTLSNTGNPFPDKIDIDSSDTLGLRLITALAAQIDGTLELEKRPYPVFTISFPTGAEQAAGINFRLLS